MEMKATAQIRCDECGGMMTGQKAEHRYKECGLSSVYLTNVMVYRCNKCSAVVPEIPATGVLHRVIALRLISKKRQLAGDEIRFLRKLCGYSGTEFAETLGSSKSFVSRIEKIGCGKQIDRTIRLLVIGKLAREIAGQAEPVLKNVTIEGLIDNAMQAFKQIEGKARSERYDVSPEDIEKFSGVPTENLELAETVN